MKVVKGRAMFFLGKIKQRRRLRKLKGSYSDEVLINKSLELEERRQEIKRKQDQLK